MSKRSEAWRATLRATFAVVSGVGVAHAGGIPDPPAFNFNVTTSNADYQVQSVNTPASSHYYPPLKILSAALSLDNSAVPVFGMPNGYHAGYIGRGFRQPYFSSGDRLVQFYDCSTDDPADSDCDNGFATVGRILMPVSVYQSTGNSCIRMILGHELFHHIEFAYADAVGESGCGGWIGGTACEGQARALQDKIYIDLDLDPEASCAAPYLGQVNNYLASPNQNLWNSVYDSALWWTYLSEQYGTVNVEPHRGIDFLVRWWQLAEDDGANPDALAITDATIKEFSPNDSAKNAFHNFAIANIAKDLDLANVSSTFRNRYSYRDEEPILFLDNQMEYGEVPRNALVVPANGTRETSYTASNFGASYSTWDVSACAAGSRIRFETDPDTFLGQRFYTITGLLAVRGDDPGVPVLVYKNRSSGWSTEMVQPNNRYDRLVSVVAGWNTFSFGNLRASCSPQPVAPQLPLLSAIHPLTPGPPETLSYGAIPVSVHDPLTPRDRGLRALAADQFTVDVGGQPAEVLAATVRGWDYSLKVRYPAQTAPGNYPLSVRVADRTTTIADAVTYGTPQAQVLLAIDTSTSMLQPSVGSRLAALKRASANLVDTLSADSRLGLIEHFGNNVEPGTDAFVRVPLAGLDDAHRARVRTAIDALTSGGARFSGLGDALRIAIAEFASGTTPRQARHLILVSDGPENEADFWRDMESQTVAAGIAVHTLALGALADQPLLERIARATGGQYRYVDVGASVDEAALGDALADLADRIARRHRISHQAGILLTTGSPTTLQFRVAASGGTSEPGTLAVNLFGIGAGADTLQNVRVFDPRGVERLDGVDGTTIRRRPRSFAIIDRTQAGLWRLEATAAAGATTIPHSLVASVDDAGATLVSAQVRRDADDPEPIDDFLTGDDVVVQVGLLLPAVQKIREAAARMRHADGSLQVIALNDEGERGDAFGGDNVWSGRYRRMTAAAPTAFPDNPSQPERRGSTRADIVTTLEPAAGPSANVSFNFTRVDFATLDTGALIDGDGDLMPDRYEQRRPCLDPALGNGSMDADGDARANLFEYQDGTDPCDADTDGGGESDDSERREGRNPHDPGDDALCPIEVAHAESPASEHEEVAPPTSRAIKIRFSTCARNTQVELRRGLSPSGPFTLVTTIDATASRGTWLDRDLTPGTTYWYRLVARSGNRVGAPSAVFSARAKLDPAKPLGSLIINDGRPRTDDPQLRLRVALYNKPSASTQVRVRVGNAEPGPWLAFAPTLLIDTPAPAVPTDLRVVLELRDSEQDVSDPLVDDIRVYPANTLGEVRARVLAPATTAPLAGVLIGLVDEDTEANAISGSGGVGALSDLKPGGYVVGFDAADGTTARRSITVAPGATADLGDVMLAAPQENLFADGFEAP